MLQWHCHLRQWDTWSCLGITHPLFPSLHACMHACILCQQWLLWRTDMPLCSNRSSGPDGLSCDVRKHFVWGWARSANKSGLPLDVAQQVGSVGAGATAARAKAAVVAAAAVGSGSAVVTIAADTVGAAQAPSAP